MEKTNNSLVVFEGKQFVGETAQLTLKITPKENEFYNGDEIAEYDVEGVHQLTLGDEKTFLNGKVGIEGELLLTKDSDVNTQIDEFGNFVVSGKNFDHYEINDGGELIYNF